MEISGIIKNSDREFRIREYKSNPRYYCPKAVNLRTGRGVNYPIITQTEAYDYVYIIDGDYEWWKVYHMAKDKIGYVHRSLLVADPSK